MKLLCLQSEDDGGYATHTELLMIPDDMDVKAAWKEHDAAGGSLTQKRFADWLKDRGARDLTSAECIFFDNDLGEIL